MCKSEYVCLYPRDYIAESRNINTIYYTTYKLPSDNFIQAQMTSHRMILRVTFGNFSVTLPIFPSLTSLFYYCQCAA